MSIAPVRTMPDDRGMLGIVLTLCFELTAGSASAATLLFAPQQPTSPTAQDPARPPEQPSSATEIAVRSLAESIAAKRDDRERLLRELAQARASGDESQRTTTLADLAVVDASLSELRRRFSSVASEVDLAEFETGGDGAGFDLNREIVSVLQPLIESLKDATESPREIERLRTELELLGRRRAIAADAIDRLQERRADPANEAWNVELDLALESWRDRLRDIQSREAVTRQQLHQRESQQRPLLESGTEFVNDFFRTRGLNLAIGVGALLAVLFGLRFLGGVVSRLDFVRRSTRLTFYGRLATVLFHALVAIAAVGAMLLAFYAVSDWLLLLLTLVFLLGVGWASLRMLPRFYEQIRLLLNLGSVREGERIVRDGIPWRVERLRVYTFLVNPMLTGGLVRLPVQDLVGLHSRPIGAGEVWFPTKRGDWVVLDDGTRGEVIVQSPDLVQLRQLGGALRTFRTVDFLGMGIRNLSEDFRITVTFGIDYSHQAISTTQIPATMRGRLEPELRAMVGEQDFVGVKVEFHEAGSSSLDYQVLADFRGGAARDSERLRRAISRILVEACNQHGWTIPFPQLTLHRA